MASRPYRTQPIVDLATGHPLFNELLWAGVAPPFSWDIQDRLLLRDHLIEDEKVSVNLTSTGILSIEDHIIERAARTAGMLVIEWREDLQGLEAARQAAGRLAEWRQKFGISIAIDDAGSGHCWMQRFHFVRPDIVKIDGQLIQAAAAGDHVCDEICRAITKFSMSFGSHIIAEWIETFEQMQYASSIDAGYGQGFFIDGLREATIEFDRLRAA